MLKIAPVRPEREVMQQARERPIFETGAKVQSKKIAVGMKFWFVPDLGRKPILRIGFAKSTSCNDQRVENLLYPAGVVGLTIIGEQRRGTHIDSYLVRFDDGTTGYLPESVSPF
jgi:hypothetical protein